MKYIKSFKLFEKLPSDRVISAKDLLKMDFDDGLELEYEYKYLFGNPAPNFSMMIYGQPMSGKTYFSLEFAYYLTNFGKVLYVSSEEFGSVTLQKKLKDVVNNMKDKNKKIQINSSDLDNEDDLTIPSNLSFAKGMTDLEEYDYIFIDSINDLNIDLQDYKEVRDIYDKKAFISILQSTKDESFRGGKDWEHEMDIACEIKEGVVDVYKNRYVDKSKLIKYDIFNDKKIVEDEDI